MVEIKDRRKVAYIASQGETSAQIVASIDGAISADYAGGGPNGTLYIVTLSGDEVKSAGGTITLSAIIKGFTGDIEVGSSAGIPIYLIDYLRYSQA